MTRRLWSVACTLGLTMIAACGGGGGGSSTSPSPPPPPPPPQNVPSVSIVSPAQSGLTNAASYTFRGTVSDADGDAISSIEFRDASGTVLATTTPSGGSWSQSVPLEFGLNEISIEATDARGGVGSASAEIQRDFLLGLVSSPQYDAATGTVYELSVTFDGSAPLAVIAVDVATGTRTIVSGEGVGAGPALDRTDLMVRNPVSGELLVFNESPREVIAVDSRTGDRTLVGDASAVGFIAGAVVDAANDRLIILGTCSELWSLSLSNGALVSLGTVVIPGSTTQQPGLDISSDGTLMYINGGEVIAEVTVATLAVRELTVDPIFPGGIIVQTTNLVLDEVGNRILFAVGTLIVSVDRASGTNQQIVIADGEGTLGSIGPGRTPDELLFTDQFADRLVAVDLTSGDTERLGGSFVGDGPPMEDDDFAVDPATGVAYSTLVVFGLGQVPPRPTTGDLLRVDPATGQRTRIVADFGVPLDLVSNDGMAVDANGDVLWLVGGAPNGLWRFDAQTGLGQEVVDFTGISPINLCYDAAANVAYSMDGFTDDVVAFDIGAGTTTVVSSEGRGIGTGPGPTSSFGFACDAANGRLFVNDSLSGTASLIAVDLASGNRTIVSDATRGAGPALVRPRAKAVTPNGATALVWDLGTESLVAVDIASGDRRDLYTRVGLSQYPPAPGKVVAIDNETVLIADTLPRLWLLDIVTGEAVLVSY